MSRTRKMSEEDVKSFHAEMIAKNVPYSVLAKEKGISPATVRNYLVLAGLSMISRPKGRPKKVEQVENV